MIHLITMKRIIAIALSVISLISCGHQGSRADRTDWTDDVIYEMNVRQYTEEGTFAAAQEELPRLKALGVDVIWLMPINPIGLEKRQGSLGSPYAISDYYAVNPEFGTMDDFTNFLKVAHRLGFKVLMDWVANHTSPDAVWVTQCPLDWYKRDSLGNTITIHNWTDVAILNYENKAVWKDQQDAMEYWLDKGVDGFRCDAACEMPMEFWRETISRLRHGYPNIFMLAEGENPDLHKIAGFDASYAWELYHILNDIAQGRKGANELLTYVEKDAASVPAEATRLMFTSNHDENSWTGTEFERMGDAVKALAVLIFTLPNSQPLIYTGQEIGLDHRFKFFDKDPVSSWERNEYTDFYRKLIELKHKNKALFSGRFEVVSTDDSTFVFSRILPDNNVTVSVQLCDPWKYEITVD